MANNASLHSAKKNKKDEFYTQLSDIEKELMHYKPFFENKTVYCNCDDPYESNFFKYFALNFNHLKLKKLIATCYTGSSIASTQLTLFDNDPIENKTTKCPHIIIITETSDLNGDGAYDLSDIELLLKNHKNVLTRLKGNGDFRSLECIELLKEADIVVTNPPFSLFREYIAQLVEYNKKFIIIGHQNSITYKEIFSLIKENKLWLGYGFKGGAAHFINTQYEDYASANNHKDGMIRVSGVIWLTNLDHKKRHEPLICYKNYSPEEYPQYENYHAINIDKTADIPQDYKGIMGVPITFLDKYNPEQFEIIELGIVGSCTFTSNRKMEILDKYGNATGKFTFNAKGTLYKKYDKEKDTRPAFKDCETGQLYSSIYARILIRRK